MSERLNDKIALISLESKHSISLANVESVLKSLASYGYYCDSVFRVAYDNQGEIVRAFNGAKENFENVFVLCPKSMGQAVVGYLSSLYSASFDALNILKSGVISVFLYFQDAVNRLTFEDVKAHLNAKYNKKYEKTYIRACASAEVAQKAVLAAGEMCDLRQIDAFFNVAGDCGDYRIEIVYSSVTPKIALDELVRVMLNSFGDSVYAIEDISLAEQLYRLLKLRRMRLCIAESFTGGGVGKALVSVPGASEVYFEGVNTYSNEAKMQRLGVKELTLKQYGAVSAETAYEMAEGLLNSGNCDIAISTTGIAGPKSDNTQKPVGLAYIGVGTTGDIAVYKFNFSGDRETITRSGINQALYLAYKKLK